LATRFEDRVLAERAKLRGNLEALQQRVEEYAPGSRSRDILKKRSSMNQLVTWIFPCLNLRPSMITVKGQSSGM
jgi:16S rRNA G527 N7-methylase RsmG